MRSPVDAARDLRGWRAVSRCRRETAALLVLLGVWVVSRLCYRALGMRFDEWPLYLMWQHIDPPLLHERLGESLLYLHAQPPLWNAALGLAVKVFDGAVAAAMAVVFHGLALVLLVVWLCLLRSLGVDRWVAVMVIALFAVSPACVAFEHHLFYTFPVCVGLVVLAWAVHRFLERGRRRDGAVLAGCLAGLSLTRAGFGLVWLLATIAILAVADPTRRRRLLLTSLVPVLLVLGVGAKNLVLFGQLGGGSWIGMSLAKMTCQALPAERRHQLVAEGAVPPIAEVPPFRAVTEYLRWIPPVAPTGIPLLDDVVTSSGRPNRHHIGMIAVSRRYVEASLAVIAHEPAVYLASVLGAWQRFGRPAGSTCFYWQKRWDEHERVRRLGLFELDWLPAATLWLGLLVLPLQGALRLRAGRRADGVTLLFMWWVYCWVALVFNLVEIGENERFRFLLDPYGMTSLALLTGPMVACVRRVVGRQRPRRAPH